jgi:hypothetical protein
MTKLAILIHSSTICFVTSEGTKSQKVVNYNAVWREKHLAKPQNRRETPA